MSDLKSVLRTVTEQSMEKLLHEVLVESIQDLKKNKANIAEGIAEGLSHFLPMGEVYQTVQECIVEVADEMLHELEAGDGD